MSKKLIKISFEEAKGRIEGQIQKGKKLSQIGYKQSRDTRDRDNFKILFEQ